MRDHGRGRSRRDQSTCTPLLASNSRDVSCAGPDSAWVSLPRIERSGRALRLAYSQTDCVTARMWPREGALARSPDGRWSEGDPLLRSEGSGLSSKYSRKKLLHVDEHFSGRRLLPMGGHGPDSTPSGAT